MENLQEQEELKRIRKEKRSALITKIIGYITVLVLALRWALLYRIIVRLACWEEIITARCLPPPIWSRRNL